MRPRENEHTGGCTFSFRFSQEQSISRSQKVGFLINTAGRAHCRVVSTFIGEVAYLSSLGANSSSSDGSTLTFTCFSHQKMKIEIDVGLQIGGVERLVRARGEMWDCSSRFGSVTRQEGMLRLQRSRADKELQLASRALCSHVDHRLVMSLRDAGLGPSSRGTARRPGS